MSLVPSECFPCANNCSFMKYEMSALSCNPYLSLLGIIFIILIIFLIIYGILVYVFNR